MRWDRFFEDLEDQLASEWEAERAALDTEAERLRLSRVTLRERLVALSTDSAEGAAPSFEFADGASIAGRATAVGADWLGLEASGTRSGAALVPLGAIVAVGMPEADVVRSARPLASTVRPSLAERMTLGFVLRDLARRRIPVTVHLCGGRSLTGTVDRAGADHLDLALHEPGSPRRASEITGFRLVPLGAIAWVRMDAAAPLV